MYVKPGYENRKCFLCGKPTQWHHEYCNKHYKKIHGIKRKKQYGKKSS